MQTLISMPLGALWTMSAMFDQNILDKYDIIIFLNRLFDTGVILEGDLDEKVFLSWLTSPCLELREK